MNSLVNIARKRPDRIATHWEGCEEQHTECLIARMADEIERLREAKALVIEAVDDFRDTIHAQQAEIERLRERNGYLNKQRDELLTGLDQKDAEIDRLRGLLREAVAIIDGISPYTLGGWAKRVREALGE